MSVDFRDLFQRVRRAPRMYLPGESYEAVVAFVSGCNTATDGRLLAGFQEWVSVRIPERPHVSASWAWIIAEEQSPGMLNKILRDLPDECNQAAIGRFFDLIDEFLASSRFDSE